MNEFERKISRKVVARAGKRFTLFILTEYLNDIIKNIKSLEDSGVLIEGVTGTEKDKKQEGGFLAAILAPLSDSLVQPISNKRCF